MNFCQCMSGFGRNKVFFRCKSTTNKKTFQSKANRPLSSRLYGEVQVKQVWPFAGIGVPISVGGQRLVPKWTILNKYRRWSQGDLLPPAMRHDWKNYLPETLLAGGNNHIITISDCCSDVCMWSDINSSIWMMRAGDELPDMDEMPDTDELPDVKPFVCGTCCVLFKSEEELIEHIKIHEEDEEDEEGVNGEEVGHFVSIKTEEAKGLFTSNVL